jgi:excisionase family DNA binding protein
MTATVTVTAEEIDKIMSLPTCSVPDAAKVLGIARAGAYKAVNERELRSIRIGRRVLVPTDAIRELLQGAA